MKRRLMVFCALSLSLGMEWADNASAVVPGSKVTVTFEGLARGRQETSIGGYDGLNWSSNIWAAAKGCFKLDQGFQSVIHKHVAAVLQQGGTGIIKPDSGLMTLKSGHFAAFSGGVQDVTFNAYRNKVLVGTLFVNQMKPQDTFIQFDRTFSDIDELDIQGFVAFDNLVVVFSP